MIQVYPSLLLSDLIIEHYIRHYKILNYHAIFAVVRHSVVICENVPV
jgi:hypothetical protein